jgi:hypothetical protein
MPWWGLGVWGAWLLWLRPAPLAANWAFALLGLAATVVVPLGLHTLAYRTRWSLLPASLLLVSMVCEPGRLAWLLSLPWLLFLAWVTVQGVRLRIHPWGPIATLYAIGGAVWLACDRWPCTPMGFPPQIVVLTAVHFHYAGCALPMALARAEGSFARTVGWGVLAAVPLTALGITAVQYGAPPWIESVLASLTVAVGVAAGAVFMALAWRYRSQHPAPAALFAVAGLCLFSSMTLAGSYAWLGFGHRASGLALWANWSFMRAWHGSANALGVGLAALAAWQLIPPKS